MTECDRMLHQLNALVDNELGCDDEDAVRQHLATCEACQRELHALRALDGRLARALTVPNASKQIEAIERAAASLPSTATTTRLRVRLFNIASAVAVIAAIVLGAFFLRPSGPAPVQVVGRLVRATGPVDVWMAESSEWTPLGSQRDTPVNFGARLRTGENILCEIETARQVKIRMQESAELCVNNAAQVELLRGQIWCSVPTSADLQVNVTLPDAAAKEHRVLSMVCPSSSEFHVAVAREAVTCVAGENSSGVWTCGPFTCHVASGEAVSVDTQDNVTRTPADNADAKLWQLPLLAIGARPDRELSDVLTPLLAAIGQAKAQHLNRQQIRQLGPPGAIGLLAYVEEETSPDQSRLRHTAMQLAADIADATALPRLRRLTNDKDAYIAQLATATIQRLTAGS